MVSVSVLASSLWAIEGETGHNCGIILGSEGAMLIDPVMSAADLSTMKQILSDAGYDVKSIVFTHNPAEDAPVLTMWPDVPRLGVDELAGNIRLAEGWEALTFGRSQAKTTLLYSREEQVIFSGNRLSGEGIPSLAGGSQGYSDALERMQNVGARFIVPSQGTVARGEQEAGRRIESDLSYIYSLRRHVITSIVAAVPLSRALAVAESIYEDYPFVQTHVDNMRYVWEELSERGE